MAEATVQADPQTTPEDSHAEEVLAAALVVLLIDAGIFNPLAVPPGLEPGQVASALTKPAEVAAWFALLSGAIGAALASYLHTIGKATQDSIDQARAVPPSISEREKVTLRATEVHEATLTKEAEAIWEIYHEYHDHLDEWEREFLTGLAEKEALVGPGPSAGGPSARPGLGGPDRLEDLDIEPGDVEPPEIPFKDKAPRDQWMKRLNTTVDRNAVGMTTASREALKLKVGEDNGATSKTWRTKMDTKVRAYHGELEGDTVGLLEPFWVWGDSLGERVALMYPGDPAGVVDLSTIANCRCRMSLAVPVTRPEPGMVGLRPPGAGPGWEGRHGAP